MEKDNVYSCMPVLMLFKVPEDCITPKEIIKKSEKKEPPQSVISKFLRRYKTDCNNISNYDVRNDIDMKEYMEEEVTITLCHNENKTNNNVRQTREYKNVITKAVLTQKIQGYVTDSYISELLRKNKVDCKNISIYDVRVDIKKCLEETERKKMQEKSDNKEKTGNIDVRQTREYRVVVSAAAQMQQIQGYVEDSYIYELLKRFKIDYRKISIREVRSDISIYILRESDKYKEIVQKWNESNKGKEIAQKSNRSSLLYEEINSFISYYNLDIMGITEQMFLEDVIKDLEKKIEELEELEKLEKLEKK
jgi:hypothetical protein